MLVLKSLLVILFKLLEILGSKPFAQFSDSYGAAAADAPSDSYGAAAADAPSDSYGAASEDAPLSSYGAAEPTTTAAPAAAAPGTNYGAANEEEEEETEEDYGDQAADPPAPVAPQATYGAAADDAPPTYNNNELDAAASDSGDAAANGLKMLMNAVPGVPGEDYPIFAEAPETAFACEGKVDGGENKFFFFLIYLSVHTLHNTHVLVYSVHRLLC